MVTMAFGFLNAIVALGAAIIMLMLFIKAGERAQRRRQENFLKVLESGVYDYRLLGKSKGGNALLGWGIVFVAIGLGILIGLSSMSDPTVLSEGGMTGSMIPLLVGAGMIVFYFVGRKLGEGKNGQPVVLEREDGKLPPRIVDQTASREDD